MGRFEHAGLAADSASQVIYMAQAREECFGLFYRFKPSAWGQLAQGGALEALAIIGEPKADTRNAESDLMKLGRAYEVYWIPAASASPEDRESKISTELYYTATPAIFAPLSSIIHSQGRTLFVCATGGARGKGQLFELKGKRLALLEEFGDESGPVYPTSLALGRDGEIYIGERRDDGKPCRLFIKRPKGGYEVLLQTKPIDTPEAIGGLALEEGILFATLSGSGRLVALIPQK